MDYICGRNPYDHYFGRCHPEDNFSTLPYVFGRDSRNHHSHVLLETSANFVSQCGDFGHVLAASGFRRSPENHQLGWALIRLNDPRKSGDPKVSFFNNGIVELYTEITRSLS